ENIRRDKEAQDRFPKRMARRPQEAADQRKEILPLARPTESAASRSSLGSSREGIHIRHTAGKANPRATILRQKPAHNLSLHVRTRLEGWLSALFLLGRPLRQRELPYRPARHHACRRIARAP